MPLNDKKMISIILQEANHIEDRCSGYREEIIEVIADILDNERQHRVQGTNIQKKISDKCNAAGRFLAQTRSEDGMAGEENQ
jgi:hypothetical protein